MSSPATQARVDIAAALSAAGITAFPSNPGTAPLPSVVLNPDNPYLELVGIGHDITYRIGLRASITAAAFSTEASLTTIEELVDQVIEALPDGVTASTISSPRLEYLGEGQGSTYLADITLTALIKKEK